MARKKWEEEHENHERWLVSYADFITLLFAFFVVMYAVSSVNEGKYRVLSSSIVSAFGRTAPLALPGNENETPSVPLPLLRPLSGQKQRADGIEMRREREQMSTIGRDLIKALAPLISEGKVRVMQTSRGVNVEINASVLFAQGEAKLSGQSGQVLKAMAQVLKNDNHAIQVEGHTDNIPISTAGFPSNWELSAARASSVARLFIDNDISESRLVAIGHAANQPVGPNDTAAGRMRNRRVQLQVLSGLEETVSEVPVNPVGDKTGK